MKFGYVGIVGSRSFSITRRDEARRIIAGLKRGTVVVTGDCPTGVDLTVRDEARHRGLVVVQCMAPWDLGKVAGPMRNNVIVDIAHKIFAVWDGNSPGTASTVDIANEAGCDYEIRRA